MNDVSAAVETTQSSESVNHNKTLSFIIPHMGREQMLIETLQSIALQDFNLNELEVVVVSKNEELSKEIDSFSSRFDLTILHAQADLTISHQRNMGAKVAKGTYLAFLDADVFLCANWTREMLALLANSTETKLVSAMQKNSDNAPALEQLRTVLSNAALDCEVEFLPGRNLCLHKDTFAQSGGFPEHLLTCEDYVFTQRVGVLGKLFYSSKSHYIHLGEDKEFWPMAKKEVWRGQSNIASLKGRGIPLSEWPSFIAPPLFTFSLLIAIIFSLLNIWTVALIGLVMSSLVLMVYSLRLLKLGQGKLSTTTVLGFYALYFPARTWGTIKGLFRSN
jgi:GT2 family glycosyltransferase